MSGSRPLEDEIAGRVREFDVSALLALLAEIAPKRRPFEIRRAGHPAGTPQPAWLEAIRFTEEGGQAVAAIAANLGLMSCRSPLPAYLQQLTVDPDVREPLGELLSLLDDRLLERRFASYRPEGDPGIFPDWDGTRRDMLCLGGPRSPAALHWLFHKVYPELRVTVRRAPQDRTMPAPDARLGRASLGLAALGGRAVVPVRAVEVLLVCHDHLSPHLDHQRSRQAHWVAEAERRLRARVFPALRGAGAHLTVWLLMADDVSRARIDGPDLRAPSYLGYDPLNGPVRVHGVRRLPKGRRSLPFEASMRAVLARRRIRLLPAPAPPPRALIFAGPVPEDEPGAAR